MKTNTPVLIPICLNVGYNIKLRVDQKGSAGEYKVRPLHNVPFCPISASGSNFNPRNILYIPLVKIFAFLELEQN